MCPDPTWHCSERLINKDGGRLHKWWWILELKVPRPPPAWNLISICNGSYQIKPLCISHRLQKISSECRGTTCRAQARGKNSESKMSLFRQGTLAQQTSQVFQMTLDELQSSFAAGSGKLGSMNLVRLSLSIFRNKVLHERLLRAAREGRLVVKLQASLDGSSDSKARESLLSPHVPDEMSYAGQFYRTKHFRPPSSPVQLSKLPTESKCPNYAHWSFLLCPLLSLFSSCLFPITPTFGCLTHIVRIQHHHTTISTWLESLS